MTQVHLVLRLQLALEPKCPIELQVCQDQAPRQVFIVTHHRGTRVNTAELRKASSTFNSSTCFV